MTTLPYVPWSSTGKEKSVPVTFLSPMIWGILMRTIYGLPGKLPKVARIMTYEIDGAVGMYSGVFNNPFLIWGKYKRHLWKRTLTVSFQFHHTQMDGAHASRFLENLQNGIKSQTP